MVRSASGTISTSWWHPSASAKRAIPPGMIQRRMWPLPRGARTTSRRRAPNRPSLEMSMGWPSSGVRLREPLGDVLRLHDHLAVDLPRPVLLEEGVELVLGEPELVHEAVLGGEDVGDVGRRALDLPGVYPKLEDLHVRERHAGLLLLHPALPVLPLLHRLGDEVVGGIEPPVLEGLQVPPDGLLRGERRRVRGGRPRDDEEREGAERPRKPARAGHGVPLPQAAWRPEAGDDSERRAPFFRRTPHGLARAIRVVLCLGRWHVTCWPACDMDENAGNLIRTLRQKLGMTQEEFAHEIAVTVSTVNRWENAHAEPSKLAWKAIHDLAHKRGVAEDIVRRSHAHADG